jgi:hypothetical protein
VTPTELEYVLLWCVALNYATLFVWFGAFVSAHDWMYRLHGRWFKLRFDMTGCGTKLYGFDVEYGLVRTWRTGS